MQERVFAQTPFIAVEDGNFENRSELLLKHKHEGVDLKMDYARDTLEAMTRVWKRPTNLLTRVDGKHILTVSHD